MIEFLPNEKIIIERRKHWFPIAMEGAFLGVIGIAPIILLLAARSLPGELGLTIGANLTVMWFLSLGWLIVLWIIFFIIWTNYYLDVLIVTNRRVIDVEQLGLFSRDVASLRLDNVQDVKTEIVGILPSLLNFGNIHVQSAGQAREFVVRNIHDPQKIKFIISEQVDATHKWKQNIAPT